MVLSRQLGTRLNYDNVTDLPIGAQERGLSSQECLNSVGTAVEALSVSLPQQTLVHIPCDV